MKRISSALLSAALSAALLACAHVKEQKYDLVIPPPPEPARYKLEHIYSGSGEYQEMGFTDAIFGGKSASEQHQLFKPMDVVSDGKGLVYISDSAKPPRIEVFDEVKKQVRLIGVEGQGRLMLPLGMGIDPSGNIFVADGKLRQVIEFAPDGRFITAFGAPATLENPTDAAVDPLRKLLYVTDSKGHRIQVFSLTDNKLLRTIGERGNDPGKFNYPSSVAVGKDGKVYVVDSLNFRYQVFDAEGKFVATHGLIGQEPGSFARPKGIALDSEGHIYVSDAAFCNVQVFDQDGKLLIWLGAPGSGPGEFQLTEGVFVDSTDHVFVVDQMNKRVQRFAYLHAPPSKEAGATPAEAGRVAPTVGEAPGKVGEVPQAVGEVPQPPAGRR